MKMLDEHDSPQFKYKLSWLYFRLSKEASLPERVFIDYKPKTFLKLVDVGLSEKEKTANCATANCATCWESRGGKKWKCFVGKLENEERKQWDTCHEEVIRPFYNTLFF